MNACYFKTEYGILRTLWENSSKCIYCKKKNLDMLNVQICGACRNQSAFYLRDTLSHLCAELKFRKGDKVDVLIKETFGWMEGSIKDIYPERFCYLVHVESLHNGKDNVEISFWPTIDDPLALAIHRTYCLEDWRERIDRYSRLECIDNGRWVQCQKVFQTKERILVVTKEEKSRWFHIDSPRIRMLWDFE